MSKSISLVYPQSLESKDESDREICPTLKVIKKALSYALVALAAIRCRRRIQISPFETAEASQQRRAGKSLLP